MSNWFDLKLDTTGPSNTTLSIAGGAAVVTQQLIDLTIGTGDGVTTGYQMKIWGDVDGTYDTNIQSSEGTSTWITYVTTKQIKFSEANGSKSISIRLRDSVYNEGSIVTQSTTLDTTVPIVTIAGPDVNVISKNNGKRQCSFSFQSSEIFDEYYVKVVADQNAAHDTGAMIGTTNGSTNMSGDLGDYAANTPINCIIDGWDLQVASAADGDKIIKVFVKDKSGLWSV